MSPSCTALSSTEIVLALLSRSLSIAASISSSVTVRSSFSTSTPLYLPSVTSGLSATSAVKINGFPASACTMSIVGCDTISSVHSSTASAYAEGMTIFAASSKKISLPYICSIILRGTLPLRNPGMLSLFLFFWYAFSIAFSNSSAVASIVSLAIFPSNFSTCKLICPISSSTIMQ